MKKIRSALGMERLHNMMVAKEADVNQVILQSRKTAGKRFSSE